MANKEVIPPNQADQSALAQSLLIGLYHYSKNQQAKISVSSQSIYQELNQFRDKIEEEKSGPHHQPYQFGKKKTRTYRSIFLGLGLIFLSLCALIYFQNMNWACALIFENYLVPKVSLCTLCILLSLVSFGLGYKIRPEKEAAISVIQRAKRKLRRCYGRKHSELGLNRFLSFGMHYKKTAAFQQAFNEAWDKITDSKEVAFLLLERIAKSKDKPSKEKLFNQAIFELNDKLQAIIQGFKKNLDRLFDA